VGLRWERALLVEIRIETYSWDDESGEMSTNLKVGNTTKLKAFLFDGEQAVNGMIFSDDAGVPSGYDEVSASYEGRFLRGAETGLYGGGTSSDSTHDHTADTHKHTPVAHGHPQALCGSANPTVGTSKGAFACRGPRHHNVTLTTNSNVPDTDGKVVTVVDATYTPAFIKLLGLYNNSGKPRTPVGGVRWFCGRHHGFGPAQQLVGGNGGFRLPAKDYAGKR